MKTISKKFRFGIIFIWAACFASNAVAGGYDDPNTPGINEGKIGSGYDDPNTPGINEGKIGSGYDDPNTLCINEGKIGSGHDDPNTPGINEGKIGSGYDDPNTPGINEGKIGSGYDDPNTPGINEGKWSVMVIRGDILYVLQKVLDKSGLKIREDFRFKISFLNRLSNFLSAIDKYFQIAGTSNDHADIRLKNYCDSEK